MMFAFSMLDDDEVECMYIIIWGKLMKWELWRD